MKSVIAMVVLVAVACTDEPRSVASAADVVMVSPYPIPEGVLGPIFVVDPRPGKYEIDLRFVKAAIPDPLPEPSYAYSDECGFGAGLTIELQSGERLEYGTCEYPAQFEALADAIKAAYRDHWPEHVNWTRD